MDWINTLSFAAVATLLVISPGPNGVLITRTVPSAGRSAGFANVAGFVAAFLVHGTLSALGISAILVASSQAFFVIKMIGAAYLCWIGLKAISDAYRGRSARPGTPSARQDKRLVTAFIEGFLTNALNPKVSMFYLAAFPQFIQPGEGAIGSAFLLVLIHALINAIWFALMIVLLARLGRIAHSNTFQRWLKAVTGTVFVGFGIKLASSSTR